MKFSRSKHLYDAAETFWEYAIRSQGRRLDTFGDFVRLVGMGQLTYPKEPLSLADLRYILARERMQVRASFSERAWSNCRHQKTLKK